MIPLYARIKDHITAQIRSGALAAGARVPSENELVESFGISRMTVNRALRELTSEGFVARIPGVGTFVREQPARASLMELRDIAEEIAARGHAHSSRIISKRGIKATALLAEDFETQANAPLFHIVMVHEEDAVPVQLENRCVNPAIVPGFLAQDFTTTTPTAYLLDAVPVEELEHTVEAALPTPEQQRLLDIGADEPCLILHRRSWSGGKVVTVATFTYPASRYSLYSRHKISARGAIGQ